MEPTVLITRPENTAVKLADQLRAKWGCSVPVVISPLTEIVYSSAPIDLKNVSHLMFTSAHGVSAFALVSQRRDLPCFAVGPATAARADELGFDVKDAGGDARALTDTVIACSPEGVCLHLRGEHVAGDVAGLLRRAGLKAREQVVYDQVSRPLSAEVKNLFRREIDLILPLYSPRSAGLCIDAVHALTPVCARLWVAAISPTVAKQVPQDWATGIEVVSQPNGEAMLRALDALRQKAIRLEAANRAK